MRHGLANLSACSSSAFLTKPRDHSIYSVLVPETLIDTAVLFFPLKSPVTPPRSSVELRVRGRHRACRTACRSLHGTLPNKPGKAGFEAWLSDKGHHHHLHNPNNSSSTTLRPDNHSNTYLIPPTANRLPPMPAVSWPATPAAAMAALPPRPATLLTPRPAFAKTILTSRTRIPWATSCAS